MSSFFLKWGYFPRVLFAFIITPKDRKKQTVSACSRKILRSAKRKLRKEKSFGRTKKREYSDVSLRRGKRKLPKKKSLRGTKKRKMRTDSRKHGKNLCRFSFFLGEHKGKSSTGCEGFLFVPFVPDSKKTKQMMKIKHPRVFFQNRGQRGQIRRLFSFPKCLFFLYLRAFLRFSSVFLSRGQRGQKKGGGDKNLSLFRLFRCPYTRPLFIFIVPFICPAACKCSSISVFPQKKQALEACGWKNGQQKKAGWLPACKNCMGRPGGIRKSTVWGRF